MTSSGESSSADSAPTGETVMQVLQNRLDLDVSAISVAVDGRTVMLSGTVPLRRMVHQIETLVQALAGVDSVDLRIEVAARDMNREDPQNAVSRDATGIISSTDERQTGHEV